VYGSALGLLLAIVSDIQSRLWTLMESFCKRTTVKRQEKNLFSLVIGLVLEWNCHTPI